MNNLEAAVAVAPKLSKAPGAALDAATAGGDVVTSAQALQGQGERHVNAQAAAVVTQAHADSHPGGLFGVLGDIGSRIGHDVESAVTDPVKILELPLNISNAGMRESQHMFRYLYDVADRHGMLKAAAEGLLMLAAGVAGVVLTPFTGGASDAAAAGLDTSLAASIGADAAASAATDVATDATEDVAEQGGKSLLRQGFRVAKTALTGDKDASGYLAKRGLMGLAGPAKFVIPAQATGYAESHLLYRDSWNRTANPQYKNKQGMLVNPGNVIAGMTGVKGAMGSALSGTANALFDLFTDPVNAGLSDTAGVKELANGALGPVYDRSFTAENLQKMYTGATTAEAAGKFDPQGKNLLRVIDRIARAGYGQLSREFPSLQAMLPDVDVAGSTAGDDEDAAYGWDGTGDPSNPAGSELTPKNSLDANASRGAVKTELFVSKAKQLAVTGDAANPDISSAGSAAIASIAGPDELRRLRALASEDPSLVAREVENQFHVAVPAGTDPIDVYGAQLAKQAGYRSIKFTAGGKSSAGDRLIALTADAVRQPDTHRIIKGLANASDRDEVMERFLLNRRTGEAAGPMIPSLSQAGAKMKDIRQAAANSSRVNYLHPIMGGVLHGVLHPLQSAAHPVEALKTSAANISHLTERIPGTSFDAATRGFERGTANLASGRGLDLLRAQYALGMKEDQANHIVDLIQASDAGTARIINRNAQLMTLLGHAGHLPDDVDLTSEDWFNQTTDKVLGTTDQTKAYNLARKEGLSKSAAAERAGMSRTTARLMNKPKVREFMQRQMDSLHDAGEPVTPDATGHFVMSRSGDERPLIDPETERRSAGAVLRNQTGDVPVMDYTTIHHMAQKLSGGMTFTGQLDDFMMEHVTNPFFKRWILMSAGYAVHVSLSEMVLNWTRLGVADMAKASYYTAIARLTGRADEATAALREATGDDKAEIESFSKAAAKLLTGAKVKGTTKSARAINRWSALLNSGAHTALKVLPTDQAEMDKVMLWIKVTGGNLVTRGLAPHGSTIDSMDDSVGKAHGWWRGLFEKATIVRGGHYTTYGPESEEVLHAWAQHLGVTANDPHSVQAAQAIEKAYRAGATDDEAYDEGVKAAHASIEAMDPKERADFSTDTLKREGDPPSMTAHESWAHTIAENVMGATHDVSEAHALIPDSMVGGSSGNLLHRIATGSPTFPQDLRKIPNDLRPLAVPGRELVPGMANTALQNIATLGYQRVLNPIVNFLSRQTLAYAEFSRLYDEGLPDVRAGVISEEQLVIRAASEATMHGIRFVHNIQDRTVLDELVHNWVPFFFAQEQAYRRMGRLLAEDPGAFRRYQIMLQSAHDIVSKQQDSEGNQYFALPGAGFLDHLTVGALGMIGMPTASINPTGFGGTLSAANVVFPFANGVRPDISPVVTLGAQQLYHLFEEFGPNYAAFKPVRTALAGAVYAAMGSENMSESVLQQVIPNTAAYRVQEATFGNDTSFTSTMMITIQTLAYQQNMAMKKWNDDGRKGAMPDIVPPANATPEQLQAFLAKVKNQTRVLSFMRALIGAVSPVSADITDPLAASLNQDVQNAITRTGSVTAGFNKFLLALPEATPFTVAKSTTATGSTLPDTAAALSWIDANQPLINQYQYGAMWLMPQSSNDQYSSTAYYEEIANGLRLRDTPSQYLNAIYTAAGDQTYYAALAQHEAALQAAGTGTQAETAEYAKWDAYMQTFEAQHPIWWASYSSGQRASDAQQSINQLTEIFNKGLEPKTQQSVDVGSLLAAYQQAESAYIQAGSASDYSTAQAQVRDQWIAYTNGLAAQEPQLASVISSVFRDALTSMNAT